MRQRLLVLALVVACVPLFVLATTAGARSSRAQGDILQKIKSSGVMKVGIAVDPPLTFRAANGAWQSMVPSLDRGLAKYFGVKLELVPTTFTTIVAGQLAGKYDFIGASLNATKERRKVLDFSIPYAYAGTSFLVKKDNSKHLNSLRDLNNPNVTVTFVTGSSDDENSRRALPTAHYRGIPNATVVDLVSELLAGHSDVLATANILAPALIKKYPGWKAIPKDTSKGLYPVGISWAVPKGQPNLLTALNKFLRRETANGNIARLKAKYFTVANSLKG
jgi:ABC-type amino acid transport substrate-binding protein